MDAECSFFLAERTIDEDISDFMKRLRVALSMAHRERSPLCVADKTEYVRFALGADGSIGSRQEKGTA